MPIVDRHREEIGESLAVVQSLLVDAARLAEWHSLLSLVPAHGPVHTGTRLRVHVNGLPARLTYELVQHDAVTITISAPGLVQREAWRLEDHGEDTAVHLVVRRRGGWWRLLGGRHEQGAASAEVHRLQDWVRHLRPPLPPRSVTNQ